jgi:uncharacterized protein (TIGR00266 family)
MVLESGPKNLEHFAKKEQSTSLEKEKKVEDFVIEGDDFQNVRYKLQPGQTIMVDTSALIARDGGVSMEARAVGGITKSIKRMLGGENFHMPILTNDSDQLQEVYFGSNFPGKIAVMDIGQFGPEGFYFQPGAFMASAGNVDVEFKFPGFRAALFGGEEGVFYQKVSGEGDVFVQAPGNLIQKDLKDGETILVSSGHLVGYSPGTEFNIRRVGGLKTMLVGGQGFFDTELRGPGKVLIQTSMGPMQYSAPTSSGIVDTFIG